MVRKICNINVHTISTILLFLSVIILNASCTKPPEISSEGPYWKDNDRKTIPEPEFSEPNLVWSFIDRSGFDQIFELLDPVRNVRKISGNPTQSMNTNSYDEIPNSSWFTNRMGLPQTQLTPKEIAAGVNLKGGPDTSGIWLVFRPKIGGQTPGFWIEDIHGNQYIIKFDPKGFPDLSTGSTVMAGRFFHACGYNVPQETIVYWHPENLRIKDGATIKDENGIKRPLTMQDIETIFDKIELQPDGSIRSLASLSLGNVKGPFSFSGMEKEDINDWCPHQHRRELRGLYVLCSFANHFDIKDQNSMNVYVGEKDNGYLDHYLLDFGSTFGSAGNGPMHPKYGYSNFFDIRDVAVSFATLGLKKWQWEDAKESTNRSVGYYESEIFHPAKWDPIFPIPPFENMTEQDGYWGAKIMLAFRDEHIRALVKAGQYSDAEAEEYLFETMKERRDKIGRYWFDKINPLDYPSIVVDGDFSRFSFHDLAVLYNLEPADARYRYEIQHGGKTIFPSTEIESTNINISCDELDRKISKNNSRSTSLFEIKISTKRASGIWSPNTNFWFSYNPASRQCKVVGIEHPG